MLGYFDVERSPEEIAHATHPASAVAVGNIIRCQFPYLVLVTETPRHPLIFHRRLLEVF
jgi:hypothetical protein